MRWTFQNCFTEKECGQSDGASDVCAVAAVGVPREVVGMWWWILLGLVVETAHISSAQQDQHNDVRLVIIIQ